MKIGDLASVEPFTKGIVSECARCESLESAAQSFADRFYEAFVESTVLVRVFVTVPFGRLPALEQQFALAFATDFASASEITAGTHVLTLLGTRGTQPQWNARGNSRGHRAIPLISDEFVAEIPMIARVLGETGFGPLARPTPSRSLYVSKVKDRPDGLFFIGDARVTTDERGRLIIPATDFVNKYGIRTVFGFGGPYANQPTFVTAIVFCRQSVLRPLAAQFVSLVQEFKSQTEHFLRAGSLFA